MTPGKISSTAQSLAEAGKEVLSQTASQAGDAAKALAADAGEALREGAERRAEVGMDALAEQGARLAESLHDAAGRQEGTFQARILETVASTVMDTAEGLRGKSLQSILDQADGFARRNPGAFVATAALLGFAAVRFARSSGEGLQQGEGGGGNSSGYGSSGYYGNDSATGQNFAPQGADDGWTSEGSGPSMGLQQR